ncbi:hypothetical protein ACFFK0_21355 [Paenibacillus chartarius]|uniref:Uncharacterized protein n=1 Tax=Paenibacillus chartarius TaxID=747481 RepID=A0ABV6DQM9_9BACL
MGLLFQLVKETESSHKAELIESLKRMRKHGAILELADDIVIQPDLYAEPMLKANEDPHS